MPLFLQPTSQINNFYNLVFPYEKFQQAGNNSGFFEDCAIFTFYNDVVTELNKSLLLKLLEEVHTYNFVDSVDINKDKTDHIPQEFLQSLTPSGLFLSRLNLKVEAPIILFCNLYPAFKRCNGTRMIIT